MAAVPGEVAPAVVRDGYVCSHEIASDARSCWCGMRVAVVAGDLQLAFFEWPRAFNPLQRNLSRLANDGVV